MLSGAFPPSQKIFEMKILSLSFSLADDFVLICSLLADENIKIVSVFVLGYIENVVGR